MDKTIIEVKRFLQDLPIDKIVLGVIILILILLIITVYSIPQYTLIIGGIIALVVVIIFLVMVRDRRNTQAYNRATKETTPLDQIVSIVEKQARSARKNRRRLLEVVRIGDSLTRMLWLAGKSDLAVRLGYATKGAIDNIRSLGAWADQIDQWMKKYESHVLIDNLGWYLYDSDLGKTDEAIENIRRGIQKATQADELLYRQKGHRHLAGIYQKRGEVDKADEEAQSVLDIIQDMPRESLMRMEAEAGYYRMLGQLNKAREKYSSAIAHLEKAGEIFKSYGDFDRYTQVLYEKAETYYKMGEFLVAEDTLQECLQHANTVGRMKTLYKAYRLRSQIKRKRNNPEEACASLKEALDIGTMIGISEDEFDRIKEQMKILGCS